MESFSVNTLAPVLAALVSGLLAYGLTRASKGHDARALAEAALWNNQPAIIAEQNKRIGELQGDMERLWGQLQAVYERERECQDQLREYRHQVRDLGQKIVALEFKLGIKEAPPEQG